MLSFLHEFWSFLRAKEILAVAHFHHDDHLRWPDHAYPRLGSRAFHLDPLLDRKGRVNANYRNIRILSRQCSGTRRQRTIIAAAQEERFTRKKHDSRFQHQALAIAWTRAASALAK
jgi:hypothetical protein